MASGAVNQALTERRYSALYYYYRQFRSGRTFKFQGQQYEYFIHRYNRTFKNERAVEIPIIWSAVDHCDPQRVLEVGNVLSHYFPVTHDIIDKYEQGNGVINEDATEFRPGKQYELVIAISTLEHIGWDEEPRDPAKFMRALDNLRTLLAPNGKLIISIPLGYNPPLDEQLGQHLALFSSFGCLTRISRDNQWREAPWNAAVGTSYSFKTFIPTANALFIGTIENR